MTLLETYPVLKSIRRHSSEIDQLFMIQALKCVNNVHSEGKLITKWIDACRKAGQVNFAYYLTLLERGHFKFKRYSKENPLLFNNQHHDY